MKFFKKERQIPIKNYIYLFILLIGSILVLFYAYYWYKIYRNNRLNTSVMNEYLTVINYNELSDYIVENKDAIIYVSILGNEKINKFENSFKNTIARNNLKNTMLYLDITNENNSNTREKLKIEGKGFPCIVVYTNGIITDTYSIEKTKFNNKKIVRYLNRIGAISSD
ncbi:MAG: DUF6568 family protein [Bacilli bacterium]|nr:DUF6568 family protein [Bacilli bacterium]